MTAKSFKQLTKDGVIRRADAYKVRLDDIVVVQGFNDRDHGHRLEESIQELYAYIIAGGKVPPLEVYPCDGDKVALVEGHRRLDAMTRAKNTGRLPASYLGPDGEYWVEVKQFEGDAAARAVRVLTSNSNLKLTPLEIARQYKRLRDEHGMGPEAIAREVGKTRQHVDQLLILADASPEVQQMVADGKVAATEAVKIARQHKQDAAEVLGDAAKGAGGKKVTAKALKPWTPPAKVTVPLVDTTARILDELDPDKVCLLLHAQERGGLDHLRFTFDLPGDLALALINQARDIKEAKAEAERKQREKAAEAAQMDIGEAA